MTYELDVEVKKGLFGFSKEERTKIIIRPKDKQSPRMTFFLKDNFIQFPSPPALGAEVHKEDLPFIRDAIDFLLSSQLVSVSEQ